jgi:hypothetical protein
MSSDSSACPSTVAPKSGVDRRPSLVEDLGLPLDELLPGGTWLVVTDQATTSQLVADHWQARSGARFQLIARDAPGWEWHLRGRGRGHGILLWLARRRWTDVVRALAAARTHPGPVVLVEGDAVDDGVPGPVDGGVQLYLASATGPVPALVFASHRTAAKGAAAGGGQRLAQLRLGGGAPDDRTVPGDLSRFDLDRYNPIGRRPGACDPLRAEPASLRRLVDEVAQERDLPRFVELTEPATGHPERYTPEQARRHDAELSRHVLELAALGVPVRFSGRFPGLHGVSDRVREALQEAGSLDHSDPWAQEVASIRLRRVAIADHGDLGTAGVPATAAPLRPVGTAPGNRVPVTVILASNRAELIGQAVDRVARQDHRPLELVVAAHGIDPASVPRRTGDLPMTVLTVPASATLGEALQAATSVASGAVVVKVDDDDSYAPTHVTDLVLALRYSGATLAGKAAEFVYLGGLDLTVRRGLAFERFGGHVAGGAIAIHRTALTDVGGWAPVPRAVDSRLLASVESAGGSIYRTHGFGFVLNRHGRGHTFEVDDTRYLERTIAQRPGFDLVFAGVDEGRQVHRVR